MGFGKAFEETVGLEGGFGKDPNDKGNWTGGQIGVGILKGTKYGISAARFPNEDIECLTLEWAKYLYKVYFWDVLCLDEVASDVIQEELFDTGVNAGEGTAVLCAQRAINFLEVGRPLDEDGVIGPHTLSYINKWCRKNEEALFHALNGEQYIHYKSLQGTPAFEEFAFGWMRRIQDYREENKGGGDS
jgi:lysozyme family protein